MSEYNFSERRQSMVGLATKSQTSQSGSRKSIEIDNIADVCFTNSASCLPYKCFFSDKKSSQLNFSYSFQISKESFLTILDCVYEFKDIKKSKLNKYFILF